MRQRGTGSVLKLRYKDQSGKMVQSRFWYILYYVNGRKVRESSKSESKMVAEKLLQTRMGEAGLGITPAQDVKAVRYEHVRDALLAEYANQGKGSLYKRADGTVTTSGLEHLDRFFKGMPVTRINADVLRSYTEYRRKQGAKDPTIRRSLVILRSMLNQARKEGKLRLADVPHFPMPKDSEPAGQYLDPENFAKLLALLPENLRPFFNFMYHTGCRLGATQRITWSMVNKDATAIKLPAEIMKARQPLTIALAGPALEQVAALLRRMFRVDDAPIFDVTNFRAEWQKACHKLGLGARTKDRRFTGLRIHDLRCSAAVNLVEAGVAEDVVMKIGGWKTRAMFSRYNVMNLDRLRAAMEQGGRYVAQRMAGKV